MKLRIRGGAGLARKVPIPVHRRRVKEAVWEARRAIVLLVARWYEDRPATGQKVVLIENDPIFDRPGVLIHVEHPLPRLPPSLLGCHQRRRGEGDVHGHPRPFRRGTGDLAGLSLGKVRSHASSAASCAAAPPNAANIEPTDTIRLFATRPIGSPQGVRVNRTKP